ncbi:MAG: APC family permease [Deltaproteobacteria bacterium]|nr:APC family permease [Deltaproteobacteria bacterium]
MPVATASGEANPEGSTLSALLETRLPESRDAEVPNGESGGVLRHVKHLLIGKPRSPTDPSVFHHISLVAFLAWVGLGADGLSSSAYGPDEAFRHLLGHEYLALYLALMMAITVGVISFAYSLLIEHFPTGGGGYVVASKLLGPKVGVVSGSALVVDYVLTVAISIAAGADAVFSFLPLVWQPYKLAAATAALVVLLILNLRGVKESIKVLLPIFFVFLITHVVLIGYGVLAKLGGLPTVIHTARSQGTSDLTLLGFVPLLMIFLRAYSLGGGTYTGIEAVSNGLQILREPRVSTGKRTMLYMATSLAFTAGGILLCYLLWSASPEEGKTMNAVLLERVFSSWTLGSWRVGAWIVVVTLVSEGALLFVAAQAGFIDGPRVLSNMALDSWVPHRFASLSERLVTKNGILLIGLASAALMIYTKGQVSFLVVLYSINVFLTFSLTEMGMSRFWLTEGRKHHKNWFRNLCVHLTGLTLCLSILCVTTYEKFTEGGWLTLVVTSSFIALCFLIQKHYAGVREQIRKLDDVLCMLPEPGEAKSVAGIDAAQPVAALLVSGYGGLGMHSLLSIQRLYPGFYKNLLFLSVGAVDSGHFKGVAEMEALTKRTEENLQRYVDCARGFGFNAEYRYSIGTEVVAEAETLCRHVAKEYHKATFYLGQLIFKKERFYNRLLHNDTAYAIQRRLQFSGVQTVILPIRMEIN